MPRRSAGPRLWFDKKRGTWTVLDGRSRRRTGFALDETRQAEKFLGEHIASKHVVKDSPTPFIADVLDVYFTEHLSHTASKDHVLYDIKRLGKWWGDKKVEQINATLCRTYAAQRKSPACARRELAFLNAALKHWHREHGPLKVVPTVVLPTRPLGRPDFMERSEAARFLKVARRTPHLARFFLVGWYTGSRRDVIAGLKWSMINLETGVMKRREVNVAQTKKRSPPVRIGIRLLSHLRRWRRLDGQKAVYVVSFRGERIKRPVSSWERVRAAAKLPRHITPHVLRHTRATALMRAKIDPWEAANSLGMSLKILLEVYGHHHPDWQKDAADAR